MTNLQKRLLTAGIAIPILVLFFWLGGIWFLALVELVIFLGMGEFYRMVQARQLFSQRVAGTVFALLLGVCAYLGEPIYILSALVIFSLLIFSIQLSYQDLRLALITCASTILGVIYVGLLLSHIILLRNWEGRSGGTDLGLFFIIYVIAITFLSDAGAFFVGRKFGKHQMTPRISPKKSWEGAFGAVLFGVAGAILCKLIFDRWIPSASTESFKWLHCIVLAPILVVSAILGDLVESLFKRDAGIKDSGTIIPGHGGILDRLDSIVFTVPVAYYYLKLIAF